MQTAF